MQYKIMGSVKKIRMKPGCTPSRFESQRVKKRKCSPNPEQLEHPFKKGLVVEDSKPVCNIAISTSSFHQGNVKISMV